MINEESELVIASNNPGKVGEIQLLFRHLPFRLQGLRDFPNIVEVEEIGSTFEENAVLKARGYALQTRKLTLADDSGLEIAALNDAPGIQSARYAEENGGYRKTMALLLHKLDRMQDFHRAARFICSMALANETGEILFTANGVCSGTIANAPAGTNGFGYDPIFIPAGFNETFGELSDAIKQQISHRGRACLKIMPFLRGLA